MPLTGAQHGAGIAVRRATVTPPPDLQSLVEQFGGYDRITAEAWRKYNAELARWRNLVACGEVNNDRRRKNNDRARAAHD